MEWVPLSLKATARNGRSINIDARDGAARAVTF